MKRGRRILFIDGSAGASGDMILGALVDVGVPAAHLRRCLQSLALSGWTLRSTRVVRRGLAARKIDVRLRKAEEAGRGLRSIRSILRRSTLDPAVRRRALEIFERLIRAEAAVHGKPTDKVHLHEAGGTDAIVDIVGACVALERLQPDEIVVSRLTTGFGSVRCAHGVYPVPGPATLELLRGVPVRAGTIEQERLTPTGAAILTTVADRWDEMPPMLPEAIGYGAGDRDLAEAPNLLRAILGNAGAPGSAGPAEEIVVLECHVDDATPQVLAHATEELRESGALDAFVEAALMKKGRPGHRLTVLCREASVAPLVELIFRETPSLGLRLRREQRVVLEREVQRVRTPHGTVRLKIGLWKGKAIQVWPEYDDCAALARRRGVSLAEVQQAALAAWRGRPNRRKQP